MASAQPAPALPGRGPRLSPPLDQVNGSDGNRYFVFNLQWRRGFVDLVDCTYEDWSRHGDSIRARQPVQTVDLTTWPTLDFDVPNRAYRLKGCLTWFGELLLVGTNRPYAVGMIHTLQTEWPGITFTLPPTNTLTVPVLGGPIHPSRFVRTTHSGTILPSTFP